MSVESDRSLADVARILQFPESIVDTRFYSYGIDEVLASWGVSFDRWQEELTQITLGVDEHDRVVCRVGGVRLSSCRQIGKTYWAGHLLFALCATVPNFSVIWTAHHKNTSTATLKSMEELAEANPLIAATIKPSERGKLFRINGAEAMCLFKNGSRFEVGARESGFGQGRSAVDAVVLDEAQYASTEDIRRLVYTMNTSKWGLLVMTGNPVPATAADRFKTGPFAKHRESVLAGKRARGAYVEIGAEPDLVAELDLSAPDLLTQDPRFWEAVAQANPAYPERVDRTAIEAAIDAVTAEDILTDTFGVWHVDAVVTPHVPGDYFRSLRADGPADIPTSGIGINATLDGQVFISGCWADGDARHVELLYASPDEADALQWILDNIPRDRPIKHDTNGIAGHIGELLVTQYRYRKHLCTAYTATDSSRGNAAWMDAVMQGRLSHDGNSLLLDAVANSQREERKTGTGWFFKPINRDVPIGPVIACCAALIAADSTKARTGRAYFD